MPTGRGYRYYNIKEIQTQANHLNSPRTRNNFIDREYWGMVGEAASNLNWNWDKLLERVKNKTLFKSGVVRNAKRLLQSPLGTSIDTNYVTIGNPEQIDTDGMIQLAN